MYVKSCSCQSAWQNINYIIQLFGNDIKFCLMWPSLYLLDSLLQEVCIMPNWKSVCFDCSFGCLAQRPIQQFYKGFINRWIHMDLAFSCILTWESMPEKATFHDLVKLLSCDHMQKLTILSSGAAAMICLFSTSHFFVIRHPSKYSESQAEQVWVVIKFSGLSLVLK